MHLRNLKTIRKLFYLIRVKIAVKLIVIQVLVNLETSWLSVSSCVLTVAHHKVFALKAIKS